MKFGKIFVNIDTVLPLIYAPGRLFFNPSKRGRLLEGGRLIEGGRILEKIRYLAQTGHSGAKYVTKVRRFAANFFLLF